MVRIIGDVRRKVRDRRCVICSKFLDFRGGVEDIEFLYFPFMSEYDEHREFLLNSKVDYKAVEAAMLLHVENDVLAVKVECASTASPEDITYINRTARKVREGIGILFGLHLDKPVQAFWRLRDFGGEEDQSVLMSEMSNTNEEGIANIIIECRRYLCLYSVKLLFDVLDELGRGDTVRANLQAEFDAAVEDFMARSGIPRYQIETLDADDWLALQLRRDMGFLYTPELGRDSIGDVPVE